MEAPTFSAATHEIIGALKTEKKNLTLGSPIEL
jgi:hypothetical protein